MKNRWILQFTTVPGGGAPTDLAFAAHTATRPAQSYNPVEYQRLNERFYTAGKVTWAEISASFYDYIPGGTSGHDSASNILYNWSQIVYSPITGAMGFKKEYATSGTLAMLDPSGGVVQVWNLFYCWPLTVTWGDLSADDDTLAEVAVTFRYDYAVKGTDVSTLPK